MLTLFACLELIDSMGKSFLFPSNLATLNASIHRIMRKQPVPKAEQTRFCNLPPNFSHIHSALISPERLFPCSQIWIWENFIALMVNEAATR